MNNKVDNELRQTLEKNHRDILTFKYNRDEYHKNTKIRDYLNKLFSASFSSVYTINKKYDLTQGLDWSGETIILINEKDEVIIMANSEWASISKL